MAEFEDIGAAASAVDAEAEGVDLSLDSMNIIPGSLCMACQGSGETRLMMTKIPLFREVILSSFHCDDCGARNTEVQFGGETQEYGCRFHCEIRSASDLDRQVVKSESCKVLLPSLDLEIPAATQRGVVTTVEGVLSKTADDLAALQPQRMVADADVARKVQKVIDALRDYACGESLPFPIVVEDPAGNSFVQPLGEGDDALRKEDYERSEADMIALGFREGGIAPTDGTDDKRAALPQKRVEGLEDAMLETPSAEREVMTFEVDCPHCHGVGEEQMCVAKIPYFKECVIMAFSCPHCGYRNSEVKGGGAVPLHGCAATLTCVDARDLSRDMLKSDTASLQIPELDLELAHGSLGSIYTTVEGCLEKMVASLKRGNPFHAGDSTDTAKSKRFADFIQSVQDLKDGKRFPFTIEMRDPLANSFIGPRREAAAASALSPLSEASDADVPAHDPNLVVSDYARTWDEDEDLGLHDIDTGDATERTMGAIPEEGSDDDLPEVDGLETAQTTTARGCADHVKPVPSSMVDHPTKLRPPVPDDGGASAP